MSEMPELPASGAAPAGRGMEYDAVGTTGLRSLARLLARQAVQEWSRSLPSGVPIATEESDHV